MIKKLRYWLLEKIANGDAVVMNVTLFKPIYVDRSNTKDGVYSNIDVIPSDQEFPDDREGLCIVMRYRGESNYNSFDFCVPFK